MNLTYSFGQIRGTIDLTPPPAICCHGFFRDNLYGLQTNLTLNGVPLHELDIGNISFLPGNLLFMGFAWFGETALWS